MFRSPSNLRAFTLFATFADLHVRKDATFANLHSYTHAYCSFVVLNEAIPIVSGSHCGHALLICLFGFSIRFTGKKIQRVENSASKLVPQCQCTPKIMWHTGDLYVANKELNIVSFAVCIYILPVAIWIFGTKTVLSKYIIVITPCIN